MRSQGNGVLARGGGSSAESSVAPKRTKKNPRILDPAHSARSQKVARTYIIRFPIISNFESNPLAISTAAIQIIAMSVAISKCSQMWRLVGISLAFCDFK